MMSALADRTAATELGRAPDQPKPWCGKCEDSRFGYHLDMGHTSAEGDFAAPVLSAIRILASAPRSWWC